MTRSKSFNHHHLQKPHAKIWYPRTFHRTNSKKEINIAFTEENVGKIETMNKLLPQSPNDVLPKKPTTPVVPIGFCPIEKKKTNEAKRKFNEGTKEEKTPNFEGTKKKGKKIGEEILIQLNFLKM